MEINELKIRYIYKINKHIIVLFFKKSKFFLETNKIINDKSIAKILRNETAEPAIMVNGSIENKNKK